MSMILISDRVHARLKRLITKWKRQYPDNKVTYSFVIDRLLKREGV